MAIKKRRSPATAVAVDQASNADRLGRQIGDDASPDDQGVQGHAVYDGRQCIGHVVGRGRDGIEAFDPDDKAIGIFKTMKAAVAAVSAAHRDALDKRDIKMGPR